MSQTQPRTPGRESLPSDTKVGSEKNDSPDKSQTHEDISLLIHSNDGTLRCLVAGDGTWLSVTDRKSKKHTTTPLKVCLACKHGVISCDSMHILLIDIYDGIWLHHLGKKCTENIRLPSSVLSDFDTVRGCHATTDPGVFVLMTERRLILFEACMFLRNDVPEIRVGVRLCIQGFESQVVGVTSPQVSPDSGHEFVIVQTDQNYYIGSIRGEESALLALYEDFDDGSLVYGNSTAMAASGPFVAFAMQGKEVHVWNLNQIMESYEKYGVIKDVRPVILQGFDQDVTMLLWSTHGESMYLTTSGSGRDCLVWDFGKMETDQGMRECMRCSSGSRILGGCFHPESDVLSLLGDDGMVSFYQISPFLPGEIRSHKYSIRIHDVFVSPSLIWEDGDDGRLFLSLEKNLLYWETRDLMRMLHPMVEQSKLDPSHQNISTTGEDSASVGPTTPLTASVKTSMPMSPFTNMPAICSELHGIQLQYDGYMQRTSLDQVIFPLGSPTCGLDGQTFCAPPTAWMQELYAPPGATSPPPSPIFWGYGPMAYATTSYPCSPRSPPIQHPAESTVYIGNIPAGLQADSISWICSQYGQVFDVQLIKDSHLAMEHKGYAFVTFSHPSMAQRCIQELHGQLVHGIHGSFKVRVAPSKRKPFKR